jgi:hypothetical protein
MTTVAANALRHSLPPQFTRFIGCEAELAQGHTGQVTLPPVCA